MFSDPQTVTINAVAKVMPRVSSGDHKGEFSLDDATYQLKFSHQLGRRTRRTARIDAVKIAANPFDTTSNQKVSMSFYVVADVPADNQGYTITEQKQIVDGFLAYLSASSGAAILKLLGGES
jgi:hypothetical protein